jgi:hypothetical protein
VIPGHSSPEGAAPCQWVVLPGLPGCWACLTGLSCFPRWLPVPGEGRVGQGPG